MIYDNYTTDDLDGRLRGRDAIITTMLDKVSEALTEAGLSRSSLLVLGFSGGADSMALARVLTLLNSNLILAYFDHGLRAEAKEEALILSELTRRWGIELIIGAGNVTDYARENQCNLEEAARVLRYRFLFGVAESRLADAVLVAHHADDQVETFLMHLLRGSGRNGLAGMSPRSINPDWHSKIPLVRPLLSVWREEINRFCSESGMVPLVDTTNEDTRFIRNRVRHELIPMLKTYNSEVRRAIWQAAESIQIEDDYLDAQVRIALAALVIERHDGWLTFRGDEFRAKSEAVRRRILRSLVTELKPEHELGYSATVNAVRTLCNEEGKTSGELLAGLRFYKDGEFLSICLAASEERFLGLRYPVCGADEIELPPAGEVRLANGWVARLGDTSMKDERRQAQSADYEALGLQAEFDMVEHEVLTVRPSRPGDRMKPKGMRGHSKKLSDIFVDAKIPRAARKRWPVFCSGQEIIWLPLLCQAERDRADSQGAKTVVISIVPPGIR